MLDAFAVRARAPLADLSIRSQAAAGHVVVGPTGCEHVLLRDAERALTLRLQGSRAHLGPVNITCLTRGIPDPDLAASTFRQLAALVISPSHRAHHSRTRLFMRDALIALDARHLGATYRETAATIYGPEAARAGWARSDTSMKERMRHALARGAALRDGAYRALLE